MVSTSGSATAISTSDIHLIEDTGEQLLEADLGDPDHGPGSDGMDFVIATSNSSTIIDYEYTGGGGGDVTDPANYTRYTAIEQSDIETIIPGGIRTYGLEVADDLDQDGRGEIIFTRGSTRGGETSPSIFIAEFSPVSANVICPPPIFQNCTTSVSIEIDISASAEVLGSFTATLTWDPALLAFVSHSGVLAGFTGNVNTSNIALGTILFNGASATGVPGVFDILIVDFDVIGAVDSTGSVSASFSAMSAALTFANLLPALDVNNCGYSIEPGGLLGDVNGDGFVNSTDALIILSFDVGLPIPQAFLDLINAGFGDVNSDGFTDSTDALIVLSFDVGLPVPFPVGQQFCP